MKVLVIGGSRFNGLALVEQLIRCGHDVTTFNRGIGNTDLPDAVHQIRGDRKEARGMESALAGRDFDVVHDTSAYVLEDVRRVVELLEGRTGHYIFASSAAVYEPCRNVQEVTEDHALVTSGYPVAAYGRNKVLCERFLIERHARTGFPASITRYPMVYGPRNPSPHREQLMFVRLLDRRPVPIPGDGTTRGHLSYVRDQAQALVEMMGNERCHGEAYNLAGAETHTDESYVDTLVDVIGVAADKVFLGDELAEEAYASLPYPIIQRQGVGLTPWRQSTTFATRKFAAHVGYTPRRTLRQGMNETYGWFDRERVRERVHVDFALEDAIVRRARGARQRPS